MSSPLLTGCYALLALAVAGFAVYDIRTGRVPNRALALFIPLAAAPPFILAWLESYQGSTGTAFLIHLGMAALGALLGGGVLLGAALATKGGIGGGDVKLAAALGFAYGPFGIISLLLVASPLALVAGAIIRRVKKTRRLKMPFVPFMFAGSLAVSLLNIFS